VEECGTDQVAWYRQQRWTFVDTMMGIRISQKMTGDQLSDY